MLSLSRERAGRNGERLVFVDLHPRPHQMQILDKLTVERELHNRRRNLIVAATGTGKTVIAAFDYLRQVTRNGGVAQGVLADDEIPRLRDPVTYLSHVGDRPISITWRLASPIPASLYAHYSTLRPT
jgi:hypothetical protein